MSKNQIRVGDYVKVSLWYFKKPLWFRIVGTGRKPAYGWIGKEFFKEWVILGHAGLTSCFSDQIKAVDRRRFIKFNRCGKRTGSAWQDMCHYRGDKIRGKVNRKCRYCHSKDR